MKLICYGSNMSTFDIHHRAKSASNPKPMMLKDWKLEFKCGYANIKPNKGDECPIVVWEVDDRDMVVLDYYESAPEFYSQLKIDEVGVAYVMNPPYNNNTSEPTNAYICSLVRGYDEFGFDVHYIEVALEEFKEAMKEKYRVRGVDNSNGL